MKEQALQIAKSLEQIPGVVAKYMPNSSRYKLMSRSGVIWNRESRGTDYPKWGNVHYHTNHVMVVSDYPNGRYTEEQFSQCLKLPVINSRERRTGFYICRDPEGPFDSLRVKLCDDDAKNEDLIAALLPVARDIYKLAAGI